MHFVFIWLIGFCASFTIVLFCGMLVLKIFFKEDLRVQIHECSEIVPSLRSMLAGTLAALLVFAAFEKHVFLGGQSVLYELRKASQRRQQLV